MIAKILSLNVAHPRTMEFEGKTIQSSMKKDPVTGPLIVSETNIEGDSFAHPNVHGTPDSVLYAFGLKQALNVMHRLGRDEYPPGALGENLTLDDFDESQISVGDTFAIGEVLVQATFPRIPCKKVDVRMQHPRGKVELESSGHTGVYFRILKPGKIHSTDVVKRVEEMAPERRFPIQDVLRMVVSGEAFDIDRVLANGAFPQRFLAKLQS